MRRLGALAMVLIVGLGTAACGGGEQLEVRAVFDDVVDLTVRAHVKIADVPIGTVREIELTDDHRALVTMVLDEGVELPSRVTADLRKTNVLGERYVALIPDTDSGGRFTSGDVIEDTRVIPELEEVVESGADLLAAVAADRIAGALEAGAVGLEGRGPTLNALLDDLTEIVSTYDRNSADLVRLIDGLEQFLAAVGPEADMHGRAFVELARTAEMLREEDERLIDTLVEVQALAQTGTDIMTTHRARMDRFFTQFPAIAAEITAREEDLRRIPPNLAMHNHNVIRGVNAEHAQVLLDFILCGINDDEGHPIRGCRETPQNRERPVPRDPVGTWHEGAR